MPTIPDPMQAEIAEALMSVGFVADIDVEKYGSELQAELAKRHLTIVPLRAQAAMIEALEPFAKMADSLEGGQADDDRIYGKWAGPNRWTHLLAGDLRKASAALRLARSPDAGKKEAKRDPANLWARELTDAELAAELARAESAWERIRSADEGGGGSPGEWAWERMNECDAEMKKRGLQTDAGQKEGRDA